MGETEGLDEAHWEVERVVLGECVVEVGSEPVPLWLTLALGVTEAEPLGLREARGVEL